MSRAETETYLHGPRLERAASSIVDTEADDEDMLENWYFWSKRTASRRDYYGSESITTVYAVKAAIAQKQRCKGWS